MFDDIIVPKSYLKGLLTKKQEKLVKNNDYQTKSLENFLSQYKIYKQKLYIKQGEWESGKNSKWIKDNYTGEINFYTSFLDKDDNTWWAEFNFFFADGVLDKKELVKFEMQETAEEAEEREKDWEAANAKRKTFQKTFKYRFFSVLTRFLRRLLSWSEKKTFINYTSAPAEKRSKEKLSFWKHY